jgi:hypothetical protein
LRSVYADAALAAEDADLLRQLVPAGCRLVGVRSRFGDVIVRPAGRRATVFATATLPPSRLMCGTTVRASAAGAGPSRLRFVLEQTADGPRIVEQALVDS